MTDHQNDELDDLLRAAAQDYNRPGDAPRDRMWSEIRGQRIAQTVQRGRTTKRREWLIPAAVAAVLLLGIAIGRLYERWTTAPNAAITTALNPDSAKPTVTPEQPSPINSSERPSPTPNAERYAHSSAQDAERPAPSDRRRTRDAEGATPNLSYQLAVVEHLAGTEAMLTSFRAAARRGEVDAQMTAWARNLLTTTRLLESSAAQQDPTMKRLLDDLELVLVQIAQYTSAGPHRAEELELIEHSIERRGVIGKLHTATPARFVPAGS